MGIDHITEGSKLPMAMMSNVWYKLMTNLMMIHCYQLIHLPEYADLGHFT